ncbi:hypothetical protein RB595_010076 [Gaeumannomyces hyphopodioides]
MSALPPRPAPPVSALPASPAPRSAVVASRPVLAPAVPPASTPESTSGLIEVATPTSSDLEVVTPGTMAATPATTTASPATPVAAPVRQPQQDYWDEKICLEVEYNADYPPQTIVNDGNSTGGADIKISTAGGFPAPGGLKRSNTNGSAISEPAPAYKSGDTFANSPASERGMWRGDAGVTDADRPKPAGETIFGYPKKKVIMIGGGLLLLIGVIIAIAVGVSLGLQGRGSSSLNAEGSMMDNTKLASINWTEANSGTSHVAVFYLSRENSLMASTRDTLSNKWRSVNVTAAVLKNTKVPSLDVLSGTPIAACTSQYQQSLYYLNSRRQVQELYSSNFNNDEWFSGMFSAKIQAKSAPGSKLSAVRQSCNNCSQSLFVTWQDDDGKVRLANFTADAWQEMPPISESAAPGTGLGLSSFTDFRGAGPFGTDTNALRVYMSGGTTLMEYIYGPENNFVWTTGNFGNALASGLPVSPSPDIASITYGANGWINNLVAYTDARGSIQTAVWRGSTWSVQPATLMGQPAGIDNFTAISATQEMRLYARQKGGKIHEFSTNASNPFLWTWQGAL